jgi:hypothetical protein
MKCTVAVVVACFFAIELASSATADPQGRTVARGDGARFATLIARQLYGCWTPPANVPTTVTATVRFSLNRDGSIAGQPTLVKVTPGARAQAAAESALRAVRRCAPLHLPADKYELWQEVEVVFDPHKYFPAQTDGVMRLANDPGGLINAYRDKFVQARESGERVVIDGACLSACTLAVGLLPPDRICVTPKAVLGFQAAWTPVPGTDGTNKADRIPSAAATQHMMNIYTPTLQQWINQHGGLTSNMIYLKGDELAAIVPKC